LKFRKGISSARAGLALLLGMAIGGARQTKKTNLEAKNPRKGTMHVSWLPGFQVSLQSLFSSYP